MQRKICVFSKKMLNEKKRGIKRQGGSSFQILGSTCTPLPKHVAASQASALGTQKLGAPLGMFLIGVVVEPPWPGALAT